VLLLAVAGRGRAGDDTAELRARIEAQAKELAALQEQIRQRAAPQGAAASGGNLPTVLDEDSVKKIVSGYLQEKPGAGLPPSVQTDYELGKGFTIRSAPNPKYVQWEDDSKIPFELRIRGRLQLAYYYYRPTGGNLNQQTGLPAVGPGTTSANVNEFANFS